MLNELNIISTGSKGNAVLINKNIMVDCGVSFKKLEGVYKNLQLVLLTHIHSDHFNKATIRRLAKERPTLRFGCCKWLLQDLIECGVKKINIDLLEPGKRYACNNSRFIIEVVELYHNVENCGYKLEINGKKVFYATDTYCLDGIEAKNYDLYLVEANYDEEEIQKRIEEKEKNGIYVYEYQALENHMSKERVDKWLFENMGEESEVKYLHRHEERGKNEQEDSMD